jgi:hypothetical protein
MCWYWFLLSSFLFCLKTSFSYSIKVGLWWQILLVFFHLRISQFPLNSWKVFSFVSAVESFCANSSVLQGFWWAIWCHLSCFPPVGNESFFSGYLQSISLSLVFRSLILLFLGVEFFGLILHEFCSACWTCKFLSLSVWEVFSPYFFFVF